MDGSRQCREPTIFTNNLEKVFSMVIYGVGATTACEKVNTTGTDENLFRPVFMSGHSA